MTRTSLDERTNHRRAPGSVPVKSRIKRLLLDCLYLSGVLLAAVRLRLRNRAIVLMYHRVLPADRAVGSCSAASIIVTPETFDWQMRFVKRFLRPMSGSEFVRVLNSGNPLPNRTCLVTFDDGWHDNLEFALPVLRKHGVPAVLFVATGYVGTSECFWQERLMRLLITGRNDDGTRPVLDELGLAIIADLPAQEARGPVRDLIERIKLQPRQDIESLLARLEALQPAALQGGEDRFLDWEGVRRMVVDGLVEIGSHAVTHTPLTVLPVPDAEDELVRSRETIRHRLGKSVALVAYPNGNASESIGKAAREAGYSAGFTTMRGLVSRASDPHLLPRVNIHETATRSRSGFLARIAGLT